MQLQELLLKLENVRGGCSKYTAKCPAHDDTKNSLSVTSNDKGKILIKCFANCNTDNILKALHLKVSDLYNNGNKSYEEIVVEEYLYKDLEGNVIHRTERLKPKRFRQSRPDGIGGWIYNIKAIETILYNLKSINEAIKNNEKIFIVEGEKDANTLARLGLAATTSPMGASNWKQYYSDYLVNASVIIIPDNDDAGYKYSQLVAQSLYGKAESIKIIDLKKIFPDLPPKGDATDFFQEFGSEKGLLLLNELIDSTNNWANSEGAPKPIPFDSYNALPEFPIECLASWQKNYVEAVAETTQTPSDLAAVLSFAAISTAVQKKFIVEINSDWQEPLNLYVVGIMNPSERKSPVYRHIFEPITEYENSVNEKLRPEIEKIQVEKRIFEDNRKRYEKIASDPKEKNQHEAKVKVIELSDEISRIKELKPLHMITDDATAERCSTLLEQNNGSLSILSPEPTIFQIMAGRYTNNGSYNIETFLKGYSGDDIRVDRQNQRSIDIKKPALTIGLTAQPEVVNGIMCNNELRGRGLISRFLYSLPHSLVGRRKTNPLTIPEFVKNKYSDCLKVLLKIESPSKPLAIKLSLDAKEEFDKFREELEPRLLDDLALVADWAGKLSGNIIRIAGLLYIAEKATDSNSLILDEPHIIPCSIIKDAIVIGKYFLEHALQVFGMMGADLKAEKAKHVLKWFERNGIKEAKKYTVFHGNRGLFRNVEEVEPIMRILIERNYFEEYIISEEGKKPVTFYRKIN